MLKKINLILFGILLSSGILQAQTEQLSNTTVLTLEFSSYLSHTDKFVSGFDIYTDSKGFTYISGNMRNKNFPATEQINQTKQSFIG